MAASGPYPPTSGFSSADSSLWNAASWGGGQSAAAAVSATATPPVAPNPALANSHSAPLVAATSQTALLESPPPSRAASPVLGQPGAGDLAPIPLSKLPRPPLIPTLLALAHGGFPPVLAYFLGLLLDLFAKYSVGHLPPLPFQQQTVHLTTIICALGGGIALVSGFSKGLWERWAESQERLIRTGAFTRLLGRPGRLETGWKSGLAR
jgi:hypothetical protein